MGGSGLVGCLVVLDCYVIAFVVTLLRLLSCARNDSNMFVSYFCFCFHWFVVSFIGVLLFIIVLELLCTTSNLLLFLRPIFFLSQFLFNESVCMYLRIYVHTYNQIPIQLR